MKALSSPSHDQTSSANVAPTHTGLVQLQRNQQVLPDQPRGGPSTQHPAALPAKELAASTWRLLKA